MLKRRFILNKWLAVRFNAPTNTFTFGKRQINAEANGDTGHKEPDGDEPKSGGKSDFDGDEGAPEIEVFGQIGESYFGDEKGVCVQDFKDALDAIPRNQSPTILIHSPGGNVWEAFGIHGMIKQRGNVTTRVVGIAASSADVIFQAGAKRIIPKLSMRMAHNPSSLCMGDSADMRAEADRLDKHADALAAMYSDRSGHSVSECKSMMHDETWMSGEESKEEGYADELTDEPPVQNTLDLSRYRNVPVAITNRKPAPQKPNKALTRIIMNRIEMIALLTTWGVPVQDSLTDDQIKKLVEAGRPAQTTTQPAPALDVNAQLASIQAQLAASNAARETERRARITNEVDVLIGEDRIPANQRQFAIDQSVQNEAHLAFYRALPARPPGVNPVSPEITNVSDSVPDLENAINRIRAPMDSMMRGNDMAARVSRQAISNASQQAGNLILRNSDKLLSAVCGCRRIETHSGTRYEAIGAPIMNDTTYSGLTVSSNLQRQVIMSEAMRAFRRRLLTFTAFAHKFEQVPLEGNDTVIVPYYPLFTTTSQRFVAANGYQYTSTDQALSKSIVVGGSGAAVKTAGQDRAYQALTFSAYLIRRQPWVDILKLAVMRAEQLAIDIINDILTAWVLKANFGNAIWGGVPQAFDETSVAQIAAICRKSDWPDTGRNLVIGTDYWTNLVSSPYVKAFLNIGDTNVIREGRVGGLYGFEDTIENPRIPATADGNLIGFACYPSAILVATAPIMPAPGELKLMVSYDLITDPQIGLTFEYKYFGVPQQSADYEIIECNYGSGLGELAALKRLVSSGS